MVCAYFPFVLANNTYRIHGIPCASIISRDDRTIALLEHLLAIVFGTKFFSLIFGYLNLLFASGFLPAFGTFRNPFLKSDIADSPFVFTDFTLQFNWRAGIRVRY